MESLFWEEMAMGDNSLEGRINMTQSNEKPRVGWIEDLHTGEKTGYNDADAYILALQAAFGSNVSGFTYHTVIKDAAVRWEADRLSYSLSGEMFPYGLDDYGKSSGNNKVKGYLIDKATGEETAFYDISLEIH